MRVKQIIAALSERGFRSPYLRAYVVARINPVRFHKAKKGDTKPPMPIAQALMRMAATSFRDSSLAGRYRYLPAFLGPGSHYSSACALARWQATMAVGETACSCASLNSFWRCPGCIFFSLSALSCL